MWRSPVAHLHGVQVVAGSNPVTPTGKRGGQFGLLARFMGALFYILYSSALDRKGEGLAGPPPGGIPGQERRISSGT